MSVKFKYGATEVEIRNPELGNSEKLDLKSEFKRAMDGSVHSFISGDASTILSLSFTEIHRDKMLSLINFMKLVAGKEIEYTDHNNDIWNGYILTNPVDFTAVAKLVQTTSGCIESYSFAIDFEGVKE